MRFFFYCSLKIPSNFKVDFSSTQLVITEPILNFSSIQEGMQEVFFEEYGFDSLVKIYGKRVNLLYSFVNSFITTFIGPTLSAYKYLREGVNDFCLIVDSGYSFTHLVPYYRGKVIVEGIRR